jgi:hypothetical protein
MAVRYRVVSRPAHFVVGDNGTEIGPIYDRGAAVAAARDATQRALNEERYQEAIRLLSIITEVDLKKEGF